MKLLQTDDQMYNSRTKIIYNKPALSDLNKNKIKTTHSSFQQNFVQLVIKNKAYFKFKKY